MEVEVNIVGVVAAAVSAMIVGGIWYAKGVFGKEWMKLVKLDEKKAQKEAPKAMGAMFLLALITSYVLAHFSYVSSVFFESFTYQFAALSTAFWAWFGFLAYATISNGMFEQRPKKLILINAGNQFVTLMVMGLVIGAIGV